MKKTILFIVFLCFLSACNKIKETKEGSSKWTTEDIQRMSRANDREIECIHMRTVVTTEFMNYLSTSKLSSTEKENIQIRLLWKILDRMDNVTDSLNRLGG